MRHLLFSYIIINYNEKDHYHSLYGRNTDKIFISEHSAGGYLVLMVALDKSLYAKMGIDADKIRRSDSDNGQTNTHYTIKKGRELLFDIPYMDEYAPITHVRKDAPPVLLIAGDRDTACYEENAHLDAILRAVGHKDVKKYEFIGFRPWKYVCPRLSRNAELDK